MRLNTEEDEVFDLLIFILRDNERREWMSPVTMSSLDLLSSEICASEDILTIEYRGRNY